MASMQDTYLTIDVYAQLNSEDQFLKHEENNVIAENEVWINNSR